MLCPARRSPGLDNLQQVNDKELNAKMEGLPPGKRAALEQILLRRRARTSFRDWCLLTLAPMRPAAHHELVISKCQEIADSKVARKVIIMMSPGTAKSTYTSDVFPPWYLARRPQITGYPATILACSYAHTLAESFGRRGRNRVAQFHRELGYSLKPDSKSAGEWETTNNGRYFCAGVGAGIAGHRADLGLIDDYLGSQEDADSPNVRQKQWDWFLGDFWPRLKPNASIIIIANRRHEDDLIGRLIDPASNSPILASEWEVIRIPFFAEEGDPLGRTPAVANNVESYLSSRVWPEWFTPEQARGVLSLPPRILSGLYQQRPAPEEGGYFKRANLIGYTRDELSAIESTKGLHYYAGGDFAVSEEKDANRNCFLPAGLDAFGGIWILPDVFWKKAGPKESVDALLAMMKRRTLQSFVAEKGHISKSIGPFIKDRQRTERCWCHIEEVTPANAKDVRARTAQAMTEHQQIRFPKFADWWPAAEHEMLTFPGGKTDDLVDALAHLCNYINSMLRGQMAKQPQPKEEFNKILNQPRNGKWLNSFKTPASSTRYAGR